MTMLTSSREARLRGLAVSVAVEAREGPRRDRYRRRAADRDSVRIVSPTVRDRCDEREHRDYSQKPALLHITQKAARARN